MTERELLDLAAKAAGRDIRWDGNVAVLTDFMPGFDDCSAWHPLTDDGDALRLQALLNMDVRFEQGEDGPYVYAVCAYGDGEDRNEVSFTKDAAAAMRLAIVRCAAVVGSHSNA